MQELLSDGSYSSLSDRPSSNVLEPQQKQPFAKAEAKPGSRRSSGAGSWQQASQELYSEDGEDNWEAEMEPTSGDPGTVAQAMPDEGGSLTGPSQEESYTASDEGTGNRIAAAPAVPEGGSLTGPSQEGSYTDIDEGAGNPPHPSHQSQTPPLAQAPTSSPPGGQQDGDSSSSYEMSFSEADAEECPAQHSLAAQAAALEDSYTSDQPRQSPPQRDSHEEPAQHSLAEQAAAPKDLYTSDQPQPSPPQPDLSNSLAAQAVAPEDTYTSDQLQPSPSQRDSNEGLTQHALATQAAALKDLHTSDQPQPALPQRDFNESYTDQEDGKEEGHTAPVPEGSSGTEHAPGIQAAGNGAARNPVGSCFETSDQGHQDQPRSSAEQTHHAADPPHSHSQPINHQDHHPAEPEQPANTVLQNRAEERSQLQQHLLLGEHAEDAARSPPDPPPPPTAQPHIAEPHPSLQQSPAAAFKPPELHTPPSAQPHSAGPHSCSVQHSPAAGPRTPGSHPHPTQQSPQESSTDQERGVLDDQGAAAAAETAAEHVPPHLTPTQQESSGSHEGDGKVGEQDQSLSAVAATAAAAAAAAETAAEHVPQHQAHVQQEPSGLHEGDGKVGNDEDPDLTAAAAAAAHMQPHALEACPDLSNMNQEEGADAGLDAAAEVRAREQPCSPSEQEKFRASQGTREDGESNQGAAAAATTAAELDPFPPPPGPHLDSSRSSTEEEADKDTDPWATAAAAPGEETSPLPHPTSNSLPREEEVSGQAGGGAEAAVAAAAAAAAGAPAGFPPPIADQGSGRSYEGQEVGGHGKHNAPAAAAAAAAAVPDAADARSQRSSGSYSAPRSSSSHVAAAAAAAAAATVGPDATDAVASSAHLTSCTPSTQQQNQQRSNFLTTNNAINTSTAQYSASQLRYSGGSQTSRSRESQSRGTQHTLHNTQGSATLAQAHALRNTPGSASVPQAPREHHHIPGSAPSPQAPDARSHSSPGSYSGDEWDHQQQQEVQQPLLAPFLSNSAEAAPDPPSHRASSGAYSTDEFTSSQQQQVQHLIHATTHLPSAPAPNPPSNRASSSAYSTDEFTSNQQHQVQHPIHITTTPPSALATNPPSNRASSSAYSMDEFTLNQQQQQSTPTPKQASSPFAAAAAASQHAQHKPQQQQQPLLSHRQQGRPIVPFIRDLPPPSSAAKHKLAGSTSSTHAQPRALSLSTNNSREGLRLPKPRASPSGPQQQHNSGSADLPPCQHKMSSPRSPSQTSLPALSMTIPPLSSPTKQSPQYSPTACWPPPACCMPPPPPAAPRPPRARHSLQHVDPAYLQAPMTQAPWGGKLYNWEAHHKQNLNLLKNRQREAHAARVQEALKTEASIQQKSQERFQAWLRRKKDEQEEQVHQVNHLIHPSHPSWSPPRREPPVVLASREREWKPPTLFDQDAWRVIQRVKHMKRPGTVANV